MRKLIVSQNVFFENVFWGFECLKEQDFCQISSDFNEQIFKLLLFVYIAYENNQKKPRTLTCLSMHA